MKELEQVKNSKLKGWKRGPVYFEMKEHGLSFHEANILVFSEDYNTLEYMGHVNKTIKDFIASFNGDDASFIFAKNMLVGHSLTELYLLIEGGTLDGKITEDSSFNNLVIRLVNLRKADYQNYRESEEVIEDERA